MDPVDYCLFSAVLATFGLCVILRRRKLHTIKRRYWVRPWLRRREAPTQQTMLHLYKEILVDGDVQEFRSTLRMDPDVYANLLKILKPGLQKKSTNFRQSIQPDARLAITLRYLALGEGFRSLSQQFRVGLSTVRMIVQETCKVITRILQHKYLKTPTTKAEWMKVATEYNEHWNFPHCLGSIDGKHIRIMAPRRSGSYFYNYKDYFSVVLLAIVSGDYQFLYAEVGSEGKASDGGIWAKSNFHEYLNAPHNPLDIPQPDKVQGIPENMPYVLVGDDAFRLSPNLMKPYPGHGLTKREQIFNYRLSRARRIVENVFGILTCRFRIFHRTIEVNPSFVEEIVMACCVLHNFLRQHARSDYLPNVAVDHELTDGTQIPGAWRQDVNLEAMQKSSQKNATQYSKKIRNLMADYFITREGEVPWQYKNPLL